MKKDDEYFQFLPKVKSCDTLCEIIIHPEQVILILCSVLKSGSSLKASLDKNSQFLRLNRKMNHLIGWTVIYKACVAVCCTVPSALHITDQPNQTHGGGVGNKIKTKQKKKMR